MSDVTLIVGGNKYPAHSQFLASASVVFRQQLQDCPSCSNPEPSIIEEALKDYTAADIQTFLQHVYTNKTISRAEEAVQLLKAADQFNCARLRQRAVQFLEDPQQDFLRASCAENGALYWLQVAHRFSVPGFAKRCADFVSDHNQELQRDSRMQQLSPSVFIQLMDRQQEVIRSRSEVRYEGNFLLYWCGNACPGHQAELRPEYHLSRVEQYLMIKTGIKPWCGAKQSTSNHSMKAPKQQSNSHDLMSKLKETLTQYQ